MVLWIIFAVMAAAATLIVVVPMNRGRQSTSSEPSAEIGVYADQLAEVDRDLERGIIGLSEAEAARTEISRRILRADQTAVPAGPGGSRSRMIGTAAVILAVPLVALGVYAQIGAPSQADQPLSDRKATAIENRSPEALIAMLDAQLGTNPNDVKGWDLAAPIYLRMGRFADAVTAFRQGMRLDGVTLRRQVGLGEALTAAAQGVVTPEARAAFEAAVQLDPSFHLPKMYLALALSQDARFPESAAAWRSIIATAKGPEPWLAAAKKELADVEAQIPGFVAPPAAPDASPQATTPAPPSMIEAMVSRLSERLDSQGGTAEEWGRLVKSQMVLGRAEAARTALANGRKALAGDATALATLEGLVKDLSVPQ